MEPYERAEEQREAHFGFWFCNWLLCSHLAGASPQLDLYVVRRKSTDPNLADYNITYNSGDALQARHGPCFGSGSISSVAPLHPPAHPPRTGTGGFESNRPPLQAWITSTAAYVKRLAPLQLLTTGQEGFFGPSSPLYLYADPGAWASLEGNDFVRNHKVPGIDYAVAHM